jgi:hypothetical protein
MHELDSGHYTAIALICIGIVWVIGIICPKERPGKHKKFDESL